MKNILLIGLLIASLSSLGQNRKQLTPTGFVQRLSPFTVITGASEQNVFGDTLIANTIPKYGKIRFTASCYVTTGVGLSNLTLRFVNGANTVTIINALALTLNVSNRPIIISGSITNQGNGTAYVKLIVEQDGTAINGLATFYGVRQIWNIDFTANQPIFLKSTLTGVGLGTTSLGVDEIERQGF